MKYPVVTLLLAGLIVTRGPLASHWAHAHGEDQNGPHGGFIRMPGAYHTELRQQSKSRLAVYLLDMNWANPLTKNSSVDGVLKRAGSESPLDCKPRNDRFECQLPKGVVLQRGDEILVKTSRDGMQGGAVSYPYPFRLSGRNVH